MLELLASGAVRPFAISLGLLAGLILLELFALMLGGSLLGADSDIDADVDFDADFDADLDIEAGVEAVEAEVETGLSAGGGLLSWLGLGRVPFLIWVASLLAGFGLAGVLLQSAASALIGPLPALLAALIALPPGLLFAREVSTLVARIMPKTESSAVSRRRLGGRVGTITQGTARPGNPAEARVRDAYGNLQYLRVVPADGIEAIEQGSDVLILRQRDGSFTATPLAD